ncbi:hypothetical protein D3C73_854400 [compost metagenome]
MRHLLHADNGLLGKLIQLHHLGERRRIRDHNIVSKQYCEWLIADELLCTENGVPESERFFLTDIVDGGQVADPLHLAEQIKLTFV